MGKTGIAIDGSASSGKSTVAKILTKQLNYVYYDTSAIYRAITYLALQNQIDIQAEELLVALHVSHTISFQQVESDRHVSIDGYEVTETIRRPDVTNTVSAVSKHVKVKEEMVALQQKISQAGGVVMDGRDISTAVLPKAEAETFLVASVGEYAGRYFKGNQEKGIGTDSETLGTEIKRRGYLDSTREVSPLVQASDAVKVDTTGLTIEEVVAAIQNMIRQKGFELF